VTDNIEHWEFVYGSWYGPKGQCKEMADTRHSVRPGYQCICGFTWAQACREPNGPRHQFDVGEGRRLLSKLPTYDNPESWAGSLRTGEDMERWLWANREALIRAAEERDALLRVVEAADSLLDSVRNAPMPRTVNLSPVLASAGRYSAERAALDALRSGKPREEAAQGEAEKLATGDGESSE
jgi:hypothetical protein